MKRVSKTVFLVIVLTGYTIAALSQNLDSMPQEQRDSILIAKSKEIVLRYGPEYYREYKTPVIEEYITSNDDFFKENVGRKIYSVIFPCDTTKEWLREGFAVMARFWGDTGSPESITFGNGVGLHLDVKTEQMREELRTRAQIPYRQGGGVIRILYESLDGSPIDKAKPKNIDELKRRGYEYKDGEWVNPKQFVPPDVSIDLLKREGYEKREDGQWIKTKKEVPSRVK
jgi:hypothetical protein